MRAAAARRYPDDVPASLDAHIRIVHGDEVLADSSDGEEAMCDRFEAGCARTTRRRPARAIVACV